MAGLIDIRADLDAATGMLGSLSGKPLKIAVARALTTTAKQARLVAVRTLVKRGGFDRAIVSDGLRVSAARAEGLTAIVRISGRPMPLSRFKPRQGKAGVSAAAWGERRTYAGSFLARMPSGHAGVFARTSKRRLPIKELWGPSIPSVFLQGGVEDAVLEHVRARVPINVAREVGRVLYAARRANT